MSWLLRRKPRYECCTTHSLSTLCNVHFALTSSREGLPSLVSPLSVRTRFWTKSLDLVIYLLKSPSLVKLPSPKLWNMQCNLFLMHDVVTCARRDPANVILSEEDMTKFGIPEHEDVKGKPKDQRALSRMRACVVTLDGFHEWLTSRKENKVAQRPKSTSSTSSSVDDGKADEKVAAAPRKRKRAEQRQEAKERADLKQLDLSISPEQVEDLTKQAKDNMALIIVREGKTGSGHDSDDAQCSDCQSWWSAWQDTHMKNDSHPWLECEACRAWFCPACKTHEQVLQHEVSCKNTSRKKSKR